MPSSAAWVDRNGNIASISVDGMDYMLDNDTWNNILNQADKEQLGHIEQGLRNAGFFHVSELPPELRKGVETDKKANKPNYPPMDLPLEDRSTGEVMLLPPHIYLYEHVPSETYSLEYDTVGHYLPPYNPNAAPYEGTPTPRDYSGAMPPVGDTGGEEQFDDYLEYAPPVDKNAKQAPKIPAPELIPLIPDWFDLTGKGYQPTANITQRRLNYA